MHAFLRRIAAVVAAVALSAGLTACSGDNPAAASGADSGALMTGGVTFGSGGRTGDTSDTDNTTMAADSGSTANRDGGVTFGSGG
jgi:hypothetical protein